MIGGLVAVLLIVVLGGRAVDELRRKEGESILGRLPEAQARAYYEVLRDSAKVNNFYAEDVLKNSGLAK